MKQLGKMIALSLTVLPLNLMAGPLGDASLKLVPGGKVIQEQTKEVKVQTPEGTLVEVEFEKNGTFEEASGDNVDKDILVPGNNLLPLKDAIASLKKANKTPVGEWSLDQSFVQGWHYEFEGFENNQKMDYVVDAKSGKLLSSKVDD